MIGRHKTPLLTCSAWSAFFAAGLISPLSVQDAAAACALTGANNIYTCTGASNSPAPFNALADGFAVGVGSFISPPIPPVDSFATITGNGTGLVVNAATFDGNVTVTPLSSINLADNNANNLRHGMVVTAGNNNVGGVNINVNGLVRSNDTSLDGIGFFGTGADSIRLEGNSQSTFNVNVGPSTSATTGTVGGGTGSNGIHVVNAGSVNITNAGSIAAGTATTTAVFVNLGQTGNAIKIGDAAGSAIAGTATINNTGTITGIGGLLSPVIYARATGGTTINNNAGGRIGDAAGVSDADLVIASTGSGGAILINNNGTINGSMNFALTSGAAAVTFNNYSATSWNTSGLTQFTDNADLVNNEGGTLNTTGAVAFIDFLDGDDIVRNQDNDLILPTPPVGNINLNATLTTFSFGDGNDTFENNEGSIVTATGNTIFLFGDDDNVFNNQQGSQFTGAATTTFLFGEDYDRFLNQTGASFQASGTLASFAMGEGDDDFVNSGVGTTFNVTATANTFLFDDGDDEMRNESGASFSATGINTFDLGEGDDDFFNQNRGTTFTVGGLATTFLFDDGDDDMINRRGADFTSTSNLNTFLFGAGADRLINEEGGDFNLEEDLAVNTFDFGDDVDSLTNQTGGHFEVDGVANTFLNLESITNTRGGHFELNGLLNTIGADNTSGLESLTNTRGGYFEVEGLSFINFNGNDNTFDNTRGEFASYNLTFLDFGGGAGDVFQNEDGLVYSSDTLGLGVGVLTFLNLETFNAEYGTTAMDDGDILDAIIMADTNYHTDGDADHYIDAVLSGPMLHGADTMILDSVTGSGTTWVHVNDLDDGPGEYDPYGVAIIGVRDQNADVDDFRLAGGPIQKGFFSYDIYLNQENSPPHLTCLLDQDCFVIASQAGQRSFELPVVAYGAQQMWHTSTGAWSDRTADLRSAFGGTGFGGGGADAVVDVVEAAPLAGNVTPGFWGRAFGATQSRDFSNTVAPPLGLDGFDTEFGNNFNQDIYGVMGGLDFGRESLSERGNQAWIFGVFGGYTGSNLDFDDSDTEVDYEAGSIGAYVTYLDGGLFVDGTIKVDFGKMDYSSDGDSASADFTSIGGVVDAGYRMNMASGWFVEPKATLAYVNTNFDNLEVLGADIEFEDGDSFRGRLGARVGTMFERNGVVVEPFVEASAWNEFDGDYSASFFSNGTGFSPGFDADGVYGEVALGASFINAGNGWSGFAKGAAQFGEDSMWGVTGNLGIRKSW